MKIICNLCIFLKKIVLYQFCKTLDFDNFRYFKNIYSRLIYDTALKTYIFVNFIIRFIILELGFFFQ